MNGNITHQELSEPDARAIAEWWREKTHRDAPGADRADLAELRRRRSPGEVAFLKPFHDARMRCGLRDPSSLERLAIVVGVLAHVRGEPEGRPEQVAVQLARPSAGGSLPRMHELRFRRLLQVESPKELYAAGVRLVRLLGGRVNVEDLAASLYRWDEETKRNWAMLYYQHAPTDDASKES